ncbi:unnamed protein product [Euphydryas editha]|uniref:BRCT domain-containing protein n=1 Tax=Euphydryas editha TaxID=104508 RepID=A0AAU9UJU3_EUPED|nr:unnamed protein product [Euphydryas editha]
MNEDINITFIIPEDCSDENECSEEMQLAFTACEQHSGGGIKPKWVKQSQWKKFEGLTKRDVFVLSQFEGEIFERLKSTKCLLVGPRCLSCCLMEGTPIPSAPEPVFTIAMRGIVVTASGLSKQQKEKIKQKVHWMGGLYSTVLTEDTTHLVANTVLSDKYIKSVEREIPVMSELWVDAVWEASLRLNVNGSSSEFDEYKLPPFANLQVTTSGISKKEKQNIMKLVNENGGVFSGAFQSETTDVVVLTKEGIGSEKYKAAVEYGKACVVPAWVVESAHKGVCEPLAKYRVAGASTSSPLAEHRLPDMSLNFSRITNLKPPSNFVDESRATDISTLSCRMKLSQEGRKSHDTSFDKEIMTEFENFDMSCIKKAGPIFDGFCIWVSGLSGVSRERAAALISRCGGVRFDEPHERVTHALSTRAAAPAARAALPAAPVLSALWLPRSVRAGRALDEAEYLLESQPVTPVKTNTRKPPIETASPMSKRNLQLLRKPLNLPPPVPELQPEPEEKDELVNQYLSQIVPEPQEKTPEPAPIPQEPDVTEDVTDEPTEEVEQIFRGIKIEVHGLDEDAICEIGAEVAAAGGLLVAAGTGGSYALVPLDWDAQAPVEMVTVFWIKDCLSQQELLPVQYYHRPVRLPQWSGPGPLVGVVASLSTYSGVERAFLDELAKLLGATTQLRFCRRNTATALASTHLICPTAAGDKYQGAVKWALPAVTGDWLLACARAGGRVRERAYLVGDTTGEETAPALTTSTRAPSSGRCRPSPATGCWRARAPAAACASGPTWWGTRQGAVKWALPAVTGDWLLACARAGGRVRERDYLVGDTTGEETAPALTTSTRAPSSGRCRPSPATGCWGARAPAAACASGTTWWGTRQGAVKWALPAVTGDWLLACARAGGRVRERAYLVGDTTGEETAPALTTSTRAPSSGRCRPSPATGCWRARAPAAACASGPTWWGTRQGAVKWALPAVTGDWLLACARAGGRVRERDYLVGDTTGEETAPALTTSTRAPSSGRCRPSPATGCWRARAPAAACASGTTWWGTRQGAVKWALPAVTGDWLLACARAGGRVRERDYLVGDTTGEETAPALTTSTRAPSSGRCRPSPATGCWRARAPAAACASGTTWWGTRQGAVKWALPAVTGDWLLACARAGGRVRERDYLVGDTTAPPSPERSKDSENQLEPETKDTNEQTDKENAMLPPAAANIPRRGSSSREQTPKGKIGNDGDADMSPASRYIAMARQGLLGCDSQETPKRLQELKEDGKQGGGSVRTPPLEDALSSPNLRALSPTTRRRLRAVRRGEMPSDPIRTPQDPFDKNPETPDSAFGAALRPGSGRLSPEARKRLWKVVHDLPSKQKEPSRDKQTPLSEIRNRYLAQFAAGVSTPPTDLPAVPRKLQLHEQVDTPPSKMAKLSQDQCAGGLNVSDTNDNAKASSSTRSAASDLEKDTYNIRGAVNDSGKDPFSTRSAASDVEKNATHDCSAAGDNSKETSSASSAAGTLAAGVDVQLQRLNAVLTGRLSTQKKRARDSIASNPEPPAALEAEAGPESQPNTVGWDDAAPPAAPAPAASNRKFMLSSNVDNREEIVEMISQLGGEVCEGAELELSASHLLCAAPGRSEKMLGSVAAGKWVLHPAYVARSRQAGRFLPEEEYEWGNPRATSLPTLSGGERALARAAHRWRAARARTGAAPFAGMRALLHVPAARRRLLARLLLAGGGRPVDDEPPYTNDDITVCFADIKRYPLSDRDAAWLISKRIPVCPPVLLSSYLTDEVPPNPVEHCIPEYRPK